MESNNVLTKQYVDINTVIGWADSYTSLLPVTSDWYYLALKPVFKRGLYFRINTIKIMLETGLFDGNVKIIDSEGTEHFNGLITSFLGIKLKMDKTYYIAYKSSIAAKNINAKSCCGYYATYTPYVYLGSGISENLQNIQFNSSIDTYGIILEGQFVCDGYDFICSLDWDSDFGFVFSNTVQQVARLSLGRWLLTNGKVTNYTLINSEQLVQTLEFLQLKIDENIKWMPRQNRFTDCYTCGSISKGEIMI